MFMHLYFDLIGKFELHPTVYSRVWTENSNVSVWAVLSEDVTMVWDFSPKIKTILPQSHEPKLQYSN